MKKEEIKAAGFKSYSQSDIVISDGGRHGYETGFKDGSEWMEEQLEPTITEYGMNQVRLKTENTKMKLTLQRFVDASKHWESFPSDYILKFSELALKP